MELQEILVYIGELIVKIQQILVDGAVADDGRENFSPPYTGSWSVKVRPLSPMS